jgi:hypothetical protein
MIVQIWNGRCGLLLLASLIALTDIPSVTARQAVPQPFQGELKWRPLFQGVDHTELSANEPRLMRGQAVRINLTAPGTAFLATPPAPGKSDRTTGLTTSSFLLKNHCQVAINGAPFSPVHNEEGREQSVVGLHVSRGEVVSGGNGKYDALLLTRDNKARVARPPFALKDVYNAVGGFQVVLKKGVVLEKTPYYNTGPVHPRSAAGISADGKYLFLLVIDGRQKGFSQGATTQEVGAWLKALGAADGLNLDGGGTSTLVVADASGKARVLNRPIHRNRPGTERPAGSHLGVFARPLSATKD